MKGFQDLNGLPHIKPICLVLSVKISFSSLHVFTYVLEKAYGDMVYARCVQNNGEITSNLVISKSRIAPLKSNNINVGVVWCSSWTEVSKINCKCL